MITVGELKEILKASPSDDAHVVIHYRFVGRTVEVRDVGVHVAAITGLDFNAVVLHPEMEAVPVRPTEVGKPRVEELG